MKKTFSLLRIFAFSIFAAFFLMGVECRRQTPTQNPTPAVSPTPKLDFGNETKKININVWYPFGNKDTETFYQALAKKYNGLHPNVTITTINKNSYTFYRSELYTKLLTDEGPDIFLVRNDEVNKALKAKLYPVSSAALVNPSSSEADVYKTASELADKFLPTLKDEFLEKQTTTDGKITEKLFGLPIMYQGLTLFINKKIFNDYNAANPNNPVKIPSTTQPMGWSDFANLAVTLNRTQTGWIKNTKNAKGDIIIDPSANVASLISYGTALGTAHNVFYSPEVFMLLLLQKDISIVSADKTKTEFDNPNYLDLTQKQLLSYISYSKLWNPSAESSIKEFAAGKVAMIFARSYNVPEVINNPQVEYGFVPLPQLNKDNQQEWVTDNFYWSFVVAKDSKNPDVAWDFIKFLTSKENAKSFAQTLGHPVTRLDLIPEMEAGSDSIYSGYYGVFNKQLPFVKSIYKGQGEEFDLGIKDMIGKVWEKRDSPNVEVEAKAIIEDKGKQLTQLLQNRPQQ